MQVPESDPAIHMRPNVTSKDGSFSWDRDNVYRARKNIFAYDVEGLRPGSYRVVATSPSSGRLEAELEVLDLLPAPIVTLEF